LTFQWCIFAEGLQSGHPKGPHSMGMLIGGWGNSRTLTASVHHCVFAHNGGRNPALIFNDPRAEPVSRFDFRNNVVYNWGGNNYGQFTTHGEFEQTHGPEINLVGNIYLKGPDGNPGDDNVVWVKGAARLHIEGNTTPACPDGTGDGWAIGVRDLDDGPRYGPADKARYQAEGPFDTPPITATPMDGLFDLVLRSAGATRPRRDEVDQRIMDEVRAGAGNVGKGSDHPELRSAEPPVDSDHDGMTDAWEQLHGLDPQDPEDRSGDLDGDGYTNVEEYLNQLAGDPV
jgi:pectate lyase